MRSWETDLLSLHTVRDRLRKNLSKRTHKLQYTTPCCVNPTAFGSTVERQNMRREAYKKRPQKKGVPSPLADRKRHGNKQTPVNGT